MRNIRLPEGLTEEETIRRICQMEACFDALRESAATAEETPWFPEALELLVQYYESPLWRHDYEMDEQGCLPRNLKRGVLSQDGIYLFLEQWKEKQTEDPLDRLSAKIQQEGY